MSKFWCKNFYAFLRYCDFHVEVFFLNHPVQYRSAYVTANEFLDDVACVNSLRDDWKTVAF